MVSLLHPHTKSLSKDGGGKGIHSETQIVVDIALR